MPAKITRVSKTKFKVEGVGFVSNEELIKDGVCPECLNDLPDPIYEQREGGHSEAVTCCSGCGATFTS